MKPGGRLEGRMRTHPRETWQGPTGGAAGGGSKLASLSGPQGGGHVEAWNSGWRMWVSSWRHTELLRNSEEEDGKTDMERGTGKHRRALQWPFP